MDCQLSPGVSIIFGGHIANTLITSFISLVINHMLMYYMHVMVVVNKVTIVVVVVYEITSYLWLNHVLLAE